MMASMKQLVTKAISSSGWLVWAPLVAAYAPRDLPKMYFNMHLRRHARRLVPFLDPFVTIDIVGDKIKEEAEAYLSKMCSQDALTFCTKGTVEDRSLVLSLREGQEVTDRFRGVTVWWLLEKSCLRLMFPQRHQALILDEYLPHVRQTGRQVLFVTIVIDRKSDDDSNNAAYKEVEAYLTKVCSLDAFAFCAKGTVEGRGRILLLSLREGQEVTDHFRGVTVSWLQKGTCFHLMFPQRHRALILDEYLPHVRQTGRKDLFVTIDFSISDYSVFKEVKAYLSSACSRDALDLCAEATGKGDSFLFSLRNGEEVADSFSGVTLRWFRTDSCFRLVFPQQHWALVVDEYLPHVREQGREIMFGKRVQRLYTNEYGSSWSYIDFEHPSTFEALAMPLNKKRKIMEDLDKFRGNKDYYLRIGKPWKRGYLLYGPPGTGKSTLIATMANYLKYDIYDIELTSVRSNSNLRELLKNTTGKSIVVVEDIDCCFDDVTSKRSNKGLSTSSRHKSDHANASVTLSGLLNFLDGIWSARSGDPRIIVLTTNFPDKLDPALIRTGRMDMHIEMSYCCFEAFKMLAKNYLGVEAHPLFRRVEERLQVVEITPADVAECLLCPQTGFPASPRAVETCILRLIDELDKKAPEPKKRRRRH